MRIKRVNGGLSVGRTWIGLQRVAGYPRRFGRRSGGHRTPGPWAEYDIPFIGSIVVSHDRTLFGWEDPANDPGALKVDIYPVGMLKHLIHARNILTAPPLPATMPDHPGRWWRLKRAKQVLAYIPKTFVRHVRNRQWRDLKNTLNGYLAEPDVFPPGDYRRLCGTGWTRRRALRSLHRRLPSTNSGSNPGGES